MMKIGVFLGFLIGCLSTILILFASTDALINIFGIPHLISAIIVGLCYFGPLFPFSFIPLLILAPVSMVIVWRWHFFIAIIVSFPILLFAFMAVSFTEVAKTKFFKQTKKVVYDEIISKRF